MAARHFLPRWECWDLWIVDVCGRNSGHLAARRRPAACPDLSWAYHFHHSVRSVTQSWFPPCCHAKPITFRIEESCSQAECRGYIGWANRLISRLSLQSGLSIVRSAVIRSYARRSVDSRRLAIPATTHQTAVFRTIRWDYAITASSFNAEPAGDRRR